MIYQSEEGLEESGALFPCLFFSPHSLTLLSLECLRYLLPLSGLGFFAVGYGWLVNERKEGRSGYPCS